jgi:microcystin degradation protein MlrC
MTRIAVGGFLHETNTFAPTKATYDAFVHGGGFPRMAVGDDVLKNVRNINVGLAGFIGAAEAEGWDLVPTIFAAATPSAHVTEDAYERIARTMIDGLASAGPLDAVYLDLHGAMVAEHYEDGEGELLRRIRALVGDKIPIVTSLDYHTNMTPEMVRHASAMVGYRTYPHIDMAETGGRAAQLLDRLLKDPRPLYKAYRQIDFLIPLVWQCTMAEPAKGIFELIDEIEQGSRRRAVPTGSHNQGIVSITHTPGFPPADIAQCGPALVVYGLDRDAAEAAADRIAAAIRDCEAQFAGKLYTPEEAVSEAMRIAAYATKPVMLADIQDNPGAGGTSDTVGVLRALIAHRAKGAVIGMMVDPEAAERAEALGEGALLDCGVGAKVGYAGETPVEAQWRIVRLGSGRFTGTGPMYGGAKFQIGPMALVTDEASGVSAVLASKRIQANDKEMFRHVGVEPAEVPILALKSTVHFRADFQPIAETILCVNSPGAHVSDPSELPYRHLRPGIRLRPMGPVRE